MTMVSQERVNWMVYHKSESTSERGNKREQKLQQAVTNAARNSGDNSLRFGAYGLCRFSTSGWLATSTISLLVVPRHPKRIQGCRGRIQVDDLQKSGRSQLLLYAIKQFKLETLFFSFVVVAKVFPKQKSGNFSPEKKTLEAPLQRVQTRRALPIGFLRAF